MPRWTESLLGKALLALLAACVLALAPLGFVGWQAMEAVRGHFGDAYVRNFTQLQAEAIREPVTRNLVLANQLADSVVVEEWLLSPNDADKRERFFTEVERYRKSFLDRNYFLVSAQPPYPYYSHDDDLAYSEEARYELDPDASVDSWFFRTLNADVSFNINIAFDRGLEVTRVWINRIIEADGERLGVVGTGFDLSSFLAAFAASDEPGVTPLIIDVDGAIQAHPDPERIAYDRVGDTADVDEFQTVDSLLDADGRAALRAAKAEAASGQDLIPTFSAVIDGHRQQLAVAHIEELDWYVMGIVDLQTAEVMDGPWLQTAVAAIVATLVALVLAFGYAVHRLVIRPVHTLQHSATAIADGNFDISLPESGKDEIGGLSRAFGIMTEKVKQHTSELEDKVRERTRELETANEEMATTQRKVNDSIDYAGLIQRALLPDTQLAEQLGPEHFVLWHPRDGVGGDFYLFRGDSQRYLIGAVDCAGHGVPGALMTMLARAAFDDAMNRLGIESPAALLEHTDASLREMVRQSEMPTSVATNLDAGLAFVDRDQGILRFAGAKIGLHWSDGETVDEISGGRRALCDRRRGTYTDQEMETNPTITWYMVTDGYLDQAGGELGLGLGNTYFNELLREHARLPMDEQAAGLERALAEYRGDYDQRDDVTVLAFRVT